MGLMIRKTCSFSKVGQPVAFFFVFYELESFLEYFESLALSGRFYVIAS